jgi:deoxyxylulose-5-phosphate synthase
LNVPVLRQAVYLKVAGKRLHPLTAKVWKIFAVSAAGRQTRTINDKPKSLSAVMLDVGIIFVVFCRG